MSGATIAVHHVRAALGGARRLGLDPAPLLQGAGIPPLLLADDRNQVTAEQFTRLIRVLHQATDDEFLGLGSAPSRRGTFAMMCTICLSCPDLGAALDRAARFYRLFPGGPDLAVETRPDTGLAVLTVRNDLLRHDEAAFLAVCVLLIGHRLASWLIGRRIPLRWARFAHPAPAHAGEYDALFGCPVRFAAPHTAAGWDAHWLSAPVVRDQAALTALLRRAPADLLDRRDYGTTVTEQVRRTLAQALTSPAPATRAPASQALTSPTPTFPAPAFPAPARLPEAGEVAARLALSPATLRRRLRAEGTSYRRLKDAVRRDAALTALAAGREPIAALAARIGFSEDTAFHRAFRRWTGTTPGAYRLAAPLPSPGGRPPPATRGQQS